MVILYFLAIRFRWYAIVCRSSSDVAIKIWSSAYSIVFTKDNIKQRKRKERWKEKRDLTQSVTRMYVRRLVIAGHHIISSCCGVSDGNGR
jgi:hypothetical protein